jgi:threonine/homoserine/homoserine lactone efflux protein
MTYVEMFHQFWLGLTSSFVGTLPLGMLNLTVLQLALANRQKQAVMFSFGASVIEFFQIGITLLGMNVLLAIPQLGTIISIISIPVLVYLGIKNFKKSSNTEGVILTPQNAFYQGIVLGFANVVVYPFWLLWGHVFVQNGWLIPTPMAYFYFSLGAGLGTFVGFFTFILLGKILWKRLTRLQNIMDKVIGYTFLGFAAFQFYKLVASASAELVITPLGILFF